MACLILFAVPLKSIDIKAAIQGFVGSVETALLYKNDESNPVEALFTFPLDEASAVFRFEAEIEGRLIVGECQEKQQVREQGMAARIPVILEVKSECISGKHNGCKRDLFA